MSFKINNGVGEAKRLTTTSFPAGIGTTDNVSVFGWMKGPFNKYATMAYLWSDSTGSLLDRLVWAYHEASNNHHGLSQPYSQATIDCLDYPFPDNTWTAFMVTCTLGGNVTVRISGRSRTTQGTLHTAWNTSPDNFVIGADYQGNGTGDSQDLYIAHVCVWDMAINTTDEASLLGGANPLAIQPSNIIEYWSGESLTGYNSTVLSWTGGTGSVNDADNPTVDAPPGGASAVPLLMQMYSGS